MVLSILYWAKHKLVNLLYKILDLSGGSSIRRTRHTPPPPVISENIGFSCIFFNKVKLTPLFQPKCGLRPLLLHILDPPLDLVFISIIPWPGLPCYFWTIHWNLSSILFTCFEYVQYYNFPTCKQRNIIKSYIFIRTRVMHSICYHSITQVFKMALSQGNLGYYANPGEGVMDHR